VVDLWFWGMFLLCGVAPLLSRLVNTEIGGGRSRYPGRGWAIFALLFTLVYNGGRFVAHARAVSTLESRLYDDAPPLRVAAMPSAWNPLSWRGVVETATAAGIYELNLSREFDPGQGTLFRKPDPDPAIDAARNTTAFRDFLRFSQFPFYRVVPLDSPEGARRVEAVDLRFGTPAQPGFRTSAIVNSRLEVSDVTFQFGAIRPR
jgi:inner membrane protein